MQVLRSSTPSHWPLGASSPSPATTLCSEYVGGGRALRDSSCVWFWSLVSLSDHEELCCAVKKEGAFKSTAPRIDVGQCDSAAALDQSCPSTELAGIEGTGFERLSLCWILDNLCCLVYYAPSSIPNLTATLFPAYLRTPGPRYVGSPQSLPWTQDRSQKL